MPDKSVSVLVPTYNRAHLLHRAIRSALASIAPGDEIVVVDDGSTDDTVAVVESFGDPVRLVRSDHAGAGAARNLGLVEARGDLIAFLDSDDEWMPDKIELQRTFMERRPDVVFTCSDFGVRDADGREEHGYLARWLGKGVTPESLLGPGVPYSSVAPLPVGREDFLVHVGSLYRRTMRENAIATFTLMVRRSEIERVRFATDLPTCEEWQAFGHLTRRGPGAIFATETAWQYGHRGPRLTDAALDVWADAWLVTLGRVWGADESFLAKHRRDYRHALTEANLMRTYARARRGDTHSAVQALRYAVSDPIATRNLWRRLAAKRA
jgi:glycosyltransferase involved in cell wall biosynthesis